MPELIRRLVRASSPKAARIDYPAGDSVVIGGWDGRVDAMEAGINVPAGGSGWEIGTGEGIKGKADADYNKRTLDPGDLTRIEATFVFVTPRRWREKRTWERDRRAQGDWRDVRTLDGEDLEQWLEQCPAVTFWLGRHLRLPGAEHYTLEQFWDEWSSASDPALPTGLLTAGRDEVRAHLLSWLDAEPSVLTLAGDTEEEAAAFVCAALAEAAGGDRQRYLDRAVMLKTGGDVAPLIEAETSMLLVGIDLEILRKHAGRARAHGHHVVVATARRVGMRSDVLDLPRVPRSAFREALQRAGLSEEEADALGWETGRSLPVLRRRRALQPELHRPAWVDAAGMRDALPLLLAGAWDDSNEHDRVAIANLADRPYDELGLALTQLADQPDPPVRKIGEVWRVIAAVDTFFLVAGAARRDDLDRLRQVALDVLSRTDPALNMPPDERRHASIRREVLEHSGHLRQGLVQGLKLIGVYGERAPANLDGRGFAERVIRDLLLDSSGERWCTLERLLPDLAEAGPDAFLTAAERSLASTPPPIMMMFEEEQGWIGDRISRHSGLLWALEGLAWHPDYLSRVSLLLANLARLDPGGRLSNRPLSSLREIFLPWLIQTAANADRRAEALDLLVNRNPGTAWKLLIAIGPAHHDSATHLHKPSALWRDELSFSSRAATPREYYEAVNRNTRRLLLLVGMDAARWVDLAQLFPQLSPEHRNEFMTALRAHAETNALEGDPKDLRQALRDVLDIHRTFEGEADWVLPQQETNRLEGIYTLLAPSDPTERNRYLFDTHWPNLPTGKERDYKEHAQAIEQARDAALRELVTAGGVAGVLGLAADAKVPEFVGQTAERLGLDAGAERELLDSALDTAECWGAGFAKGFLVSRIGREGWPAAETLLARAREDGWHQERLLRLLFALPESAQLWDVVAAVGDDINRRYWSEIGRLFVRDADEAERAVDSLLGAQRPLAAYDAVHFLIAELRGTTVVRLLSAVAGANDPAGSSHRLQPYHIEKAFRAIDGSDDVPIDVILGLEWVFFEFLENTKRQPRELYRALAEDPTLFVTFLRWAFKPVNAGRDDAGEEDVLPQRRQRARDVVHSWKRMPGSAEDGTIDPIVLMEWVQQARQQSREADRLETFDYWIGHVLASSPTGEDEAWPAEPVRDVIDRIASEALDDGFGVGVYNARGAVWRGHGGQQERELAERYRYWAGQIAGRWPRTATILRRIAEGYEAEGRHWDIDDELRDLD